jgi:hypothetical protein
MEVKNIRKLLFIFFFSFYEYVARMQEGRSAFKILTVEHTRKRP